MSQWFHLLRAVVLAGLLPGLWFLPIAARAQRTPAAPAKSTPKSKASPGPESKSVENLTSTALKAVVVITHFGRNGKEDGVGAGFVVAPDGLIATSLHVIGEARPIHVRLATGEEQEVTEIFAWDRKLDLALIRINAKNLTALPLGDSDSLKQGASVVALGNPLGLEHSVVQGVLSARREMDGSPMLQLAIPIEPGNSGGPLLDLKGRVHGILTLKSALTPNLGFAVPVNLLKSLLDHPNPVPMARWLTIGALNPKEWSPVFGARWSQKAGRIQVEGAGRGFGGRSLCLYQKPVPAPPYEIGVKVRLDDEAGAAGLIFMADGNDVHYGFYPSAGQLRLTRFEGPSVYSWTILKQVPSEFYRRGDWNDLRVRVEADRFLCYVNGHLAVESQDNALSAGRVGLAKFRDTRAEFRGFQLGTNLLAPVRESAALPAETIKALEESDPAAEPAADLLKELSKEGQPGRQALAQRAQRLEKQAQHLRRLAATLHRQAVQESLVQTLDQPEGQIDLLRAALLVSQLDNPDLDIESYRQQVAEMASELRARLPAAADEPARLRALRDYLFAENGFHGSRSDYYNRANSYLNEVLDDREGLPITLSVLFLEMAQRLGVSRVSGLPLPGHFMVRYSPEAAEDQIIDVHAGGEFLSRTQAQEKIMETTGAGFRDSDYRRATKREIIVRMLRNLMSPEERDENVDPLRYLEVIVALEPDSATDRLRRALLRLQSGDSTGAKADFRWLLDRQPAGMDLERVAELYRSL
jgi:regulator of sirC expression with transglutaminase-like and TPR domain